MVFLSLMLVSVGKILSLSLRCLRTLLQRGESVDCCRMETHEGKENSELEGWSWEGHKSSVYIVF
jgi:hypothetical protein